MDLARAPCRAPLTARKKGSGYENGLVQNKQCDQMWYFITTVVIFRHFLNDCGNLKNS